tara:strand:- start:1542 stop:1796 length:255 start_codon:yes stop_codon:yes gene_type:complete
MPELTKHEQHLVEVAIQATKAGLDAVQRDVFAMHALQGLLARPNSTPEWPLPGRPELARKSPEHYAAAAYQLAELMMAERERFR